jgi:hypothetical protein
MMQHETCADGVPAAWVDECQGHSSGQTRSACPGVSSRELESKLPKGRGSSVSGGPVRPEITFECDDFIRAWA